jgi:hypothetical protein
VALTAAAQAAGGSFLRVRFCANCQCWHRTEEGSVIFTHSPTQLWHSQQQHKQQVEAFYASDSVPIASAGIVQKKAVPFSRILQHSCGTHSSNISSMETDKAPTSTPTAVVSAMRQ